MSAHTPGPWLVHNALLGHKGDVFSPTAEKVAECHHIARCFAPKPTKPILSDLDAIAVEREAIGIIEANARLISAAPMLLDALQSIMRHGELANIDKGGPFSNGGKKPATMDAWAFPRHLLKDVEAAIASAQGSGP